MNVYAGRLYQQREQDGTLTYPVPLQPSEEIAQTLGRDRLLVRTPHGLAVRYLVPETEEHLYPFARIVG